MTDIIGSEIPMEGRIRNLQGTFTESVNLQVSYAVEQINGVDNPNYHTAVIYDAEIVDRNTINELSTEIVLDSDGSHSLDVRRLPAFAPPTGHINYAYGNNVYIFWDQATDEDTNRYVVKLGTTTVATLTQAVVDAKYYQPTTGGGRYSVQGTSAISINKSFTVAFTGETFTFDDTVYDFPAAGTTYSLPYGILLTLHDDPATYTNFDVFVGIQSYVVLNNQPTGANTYTITPYDVAGNAGDTKTRTVFVQELPDNFTFDATTNTVTAFGANNDEIRVYADYLPANQLQLEYIYEQQPVQILNIGSPTVNLPIGTKFYLWPVVDGIEHRNLTIYEIPDPTIIVGTLEQPLDVSLLPTANGTFEIEFTYQMLETDKAVGFRLYHYDDLIPAFVSYEDLINIAQPSQIYGEVLQFNYAIPDSFNHETEHQFYVVAVDSAFTEGENSAVVSAFADADAPEITGTLNGLNI